jgi:hypothetical protein
VGDPGSADVCEQSKPRALGLDPIYTSHPGLLKLVSEGAIPP